MPTDWTTDRTTDLSDPFLLRRNGLNVIEAEILAGGGGGTGVGGRTVTFSQAAGAPAITGGSPKVLVPLATASVTRIALSTVSAPQGGPLTVQFLNNGVVFSTLQITDGSTVSATSTTDLPTVVINDELTVNATEVGAGVPAQGITATMELG